MGAGYFMKYYIFCPFKQKLYIGVYQKNLIKKSKKLDN